VLVSPASGAPSNERKRVQSWGDQSCRVRAPQCEKVKAQAVSDILINSIRFLEDMMLTLPKNFDLARLVNDNHAYFLHQIGGYARLADPNLSSEEVENMISFAALDTMKLFIPLTLGAQYVKNNKEFHLLAGLLNPMNKMLDLVQGRHFEHSLVEDRKKVAKLADEVLVAYSQLREHYQETAEH
jgi:hypothetical protein